MNADSFVSYARNAEDVVLARALRDVVDGRYIEVGANDPTNDSVSMAFYQRGWSGITVEPVHVYAERHRAERPRDTLIEAAISDHSSGTVVPQQFANSGHSTVFDRVAGTHRASARDATKVAVRSRRLDDVLNDAGWHGEDIHFMVVDTEGAERTVLDTIDLHRWRPWVLVIEATEPDSTTASHGAWESMVLDAGYRFCLFDGLSRFYAAQERYEELHARLSYPACIHDNYESRAMVELRATVSRMKQDVTRLNDEVAQLLEQVALMETLRGDRGRLQAELLQARSHEAQALASAVRWRQKAVHEWSQAATGSNAREADLSTAHEQARALSGELGAIKRTLSWRITAPLRSARRVVPPRTGEIAPRNNVELAPRQIGS